MGKYIRYFALYVGFPAAIIVLYPAAAMFSEPFFEELFNKLGWDTEDFAVPFLMALDEIFQSDTFRFLAAIALGFCLGVWAHWTAAKYDRSKKNTKKVTAILVVSQMN